jgi:hypothetical protein
MTTKKLEEKILALERQLCNCCKMLPTTDGIPTEAPTNGQTVKIDLSTGIIYYYDSDTSTWEPTPTGGGGGFFTSSVNAPAGAVIQDGNSGNYTIDNLDQLNVNAGVGGQIILTTEGISGDSSVGAVDGNAYLAYEGSGNRATVIATEDYVLLLSTNGNLHLSDGGTLYSNPPSDDTLDSIVVLDPSDGKVYLRDAATIGGGGAAYVEVTYAAAEALVAGSTLVPGTLYKITDRGDRGIFLTALSVNEFSQTGHRLMLIPTSYAEGASVTYNGNVYTSKSVFNKGRFDNLEYAVDDLIIFNGHYWFCIDGAASGPPNDLASIQEGLFAASWLRIEKNDPLASLTYVEKWFDIKYDFSNDWIFEQSDNWGNVVGISYNQKQYMYALTANPVDYTDWGLADFVYSIGSNVTVSENKCPLGFYNNSTSSMTGDNMLIHSNTCSAIVNNFTAGNTIGIRRNTGKTQEVANVGGIVNNSYYPADLIIDENTFKSEGIYGNTVRVISGNISGYGISNNVADEIKYNIIWGGITDNTLAGFEITSNNVIDEISGNTCNGSITYNRCTTITDNSNTDYIAYNTNNSSIAANSNSGNIGYNSNNGVININSNSGSIQHNSNLGNIADNSNGGDIKFNSNNGGIESNSHDGELLHNSNNGNIVNCVGAGGFNVEYNTNNGVINNPAGLAVADITDVIVNK